MADFSPERERELAHAPEQKHEAGKAPTEQLDTLAQFEVREFAEELSDGAEVAREHVSESGEQVGESKGVGLAKAHVHKQTKAHIGQLRRHIGDIPGERVMVRQIRRKLHNEVSDLLSQVHRERYARNFNPSKMNSLLARARQLKETIASLASMTYEMLKNVWLRVVKGLV